MTCYRPWYKRTSLAIPSSQVRFSFPHRAPSIALIRDREKDRRAGKPPADRRQGMSFEDRVNRRLDLWLARHPGAPPDQIKRKQRSIARRLNEEEGAERQDRQK